MVDIEKLAELDKLATKAPWEWDTRPSPYGPVVPQGSYLGITLITLGDRYEGCDEDCALVEELRNQCAAMIAEIRAARELAERFRFVLDGGPTIVGRGGDLDELLERYEAARDGGGSP